MKGYGPLTERQAQVLQLMAWEYSIDDIAEALGLSTWTIKNHIVRLNVALGTTGMNRAASVTTGLRLGIITLDPPSRVAGVNDLEVA